MRSSFVPQNRGSALPSTRNIVFRFEEAERAAWAIHRENPMYVTEEIVQRFVKKARRG